jgi:hypothetical protein
LQDPRPPGHRRARPRNRSGALGAKKQTVGKGWEGDRYRRRCAHRCEAAAASANLRMKDRADPVERLANARSTTPIR